MKRSRSSFAPLLGLAAAILSAGSLCADEVEIALDLGGGNLKLIIIELDEARAPKTCANFKKLARDGYFAGMAVHRVLPGTLVQLGDPLTKDPARKAVWGTGGPGYTVPAELGGSHERGAVAMARLGDATNDAKASSGSQFYITLKAIPALDGDYTVFGKVVGGMRYLDDLSQRPADSNDVPLDRVEVVTSRLVDSSGKLVAKADPKPAPPAPADPPEPEAMKKEEKKAPAPEPEAMKKTEVAAADASGDNQAPTYRNKGRVDHGEGTGTLPEPQPATEPLASTSDAPPAALPEGSLAKEMSIAPPSGATEAPKADGPVTRFIKRFW